MRLMELIYSSIKLLLVHGNLEVYVPLDEGGVEIANKIEICEDEYFKDSFDHPFIWIDWT